MVRGWEMKTWKTFIAVVCCCGLAVGYGLIGCDDQGDADHAVCQDNDGDGYGNPSSAACVHSGLDCDDTDEDVYPNATELCDGIDNQCPGDSKVMAWLTLTPLASALLMEGASSLRSEKWWIIARSLTLRPYSLREDRSDPWSCPAFRIYVRRSFHSAHRSVRYL
jgi:hypothetical protein